LGEQFDRLREPQRVEARYARRQQPNGGRGTPSLVMQIDPESSDSPDPERRVNDMGVTVDATRVRREGWENGIFDIHAIQRPFGERLHPSVNTNRWRSAPDQQQIAAVARREQAQPALYSREISRPRGGCSARMELEDQPIDIVVVRHLLLTAPSSARQAFYWSESDLGSGIRGSRWPRH
jgi:hypothetical protein